MNVICYEILHLLSFWNSHYVSNLVEELREYKYTLCQVEYLISIFLFAYNLILFKSL